MLLQGCESDLWECGEQGNGNAHRPPRARSSTRVSSNVVIMVISFVVMIMIMIFLLFISGVRSDCNVGEGCSDRVILWQEWVVNKMDNRLHISCGGIIFQSSYTYFIGSFSYLASLNIAREWIGVNRRVRTKMQMVSWATCILWVPFFDKVYRYRVPVDHIYNFSLFEIWNIVCNKMDVVFEEIFQSFIA